MSRIFVTGDKHGSLEINTIGHGSFPLGKRLNHNDVMIITGDMGSMWDNSKETTYWDNWTNELGFTVCTAYGNHENYTAIRSLPVEEWNGGKVRRVRQNVIYLENGEIFNINGKTVFVQGGAASTDRYRRVEGKSWWPEEIPSAKEFENAAINLEKVNFNVDIIISHTAPDSILSRVYKFLPREDDVSHFLERYVMNQVTYKNWFCGHHHVDISIVEKNVHLLYHDIIEIFPDNTIQVV